MAPALVLSFFRPAPEQALLRIRLSFSLKMVTASESFSSRMLCPHDHLIRASMREKLFLLFLIWNLHSLFTSVV